MADGSVKSGTPSLVGTNSPKPQSIVDPTEDNTLELTIQPNGRHLYT